VSLWRDKNRKDWRYRFEVNKKVYAGGGFQTKAEARAAREERRKEVKSQPDQATTPMLFSQVATEYLKWSERRHADKTIAYKKTVFRNFLAHSEDQPFERISSLALHDYLSTRPSNHNYNVHRKELCSLFSWANKHLGLALVSPCLHLEKLPEAQRRKTIPTQEEFARILSAATPDEKPLLIILAHTLARIDELLRLQWDDVNFERLTVTLWTRKRKDGNWEPRHIPMNDTLHSTLKPLWNRREQQEWVFFNRKEGTRYNRRPKMMKAICKRAGVAYYGFHAIRHFTATYLHDALKVPTGVIGGLLGHKEKRTTEIYLHSVEESAREAMKKLNDLLAVHACCFEGKGG
jgi:integrase